ncbi:unnamed protein product, partial [Ectocarpus sp. 8 AP-2014]
LTDRYINSSSCWRQTCDILFPQQRGSSRRISYCCGPVFVSVSEARTARNTPRLLHCFRASHQQHVFQQYPGTQTHVFPKKRAVPLTPCATHFTHPFYRTPLISMETFNMGIIKKTSYVLRCINQKYKIPRTGRKRSLLST